MNESKMTRGKVKCLVWDLDCTLWQGILSEGDITEVLPQVVEVIRVLDARGILQSIASKNDFEPAMARLRQLGLAEYFIYPQINWGPKSASIKRIAERINIGIDAIAFIDDQAFEREEVGFSHPGVLCLDAAGLSELLAQPELMPRFLTDESATRRLMYQRDAVRQEEEDRFDGPKEAFLASLDMVFSVSRAESADLQRLEELTARTHQLNTTGHVYTHDELDRFRTSEHHELLVAALDDKYGAYGKIGLVLIEKAADIWNIKLMLMSCRVMSRGVGTILLNLVLTMARERGVGLRAKMVLNDRNRMMYMTYKFAGFTPMMKDGNREVLQHDLRQIPETPPYVRVQLTPNPF
jgi:FkbH-like protein